MSRNSGQDVTLFITVGGKFSIAEYNKLANHFCRFHAGAQLISTAGILTISDSAFKAALREYEEDSETETDGENGETD